jgi:pilus assembly protein CpaF
MGLLNRSLLNRINKAPLGPEQDIKLTVEPVTTLQMTQIQESYQDVKERIHRRLIDSLDLTHLDSIPRDVLKFQIREVVESLLAEERDIGFGLNRDQIIEEVLNEIFGLGPLEPLIKDPTVSDILVNTYKKVYVERFGKLELTNTVFKNEEYLLHVIDRIVSQIGRRVNESSPMVDARLPDGSRVNAIIPPLAVDGSILSIRKFSIRKLNIDDLIILGTLTPQIADVLKGVVKARLNVLISGGTGSGKTTLLNTLSGFIPATERIITIEDAAELQLQQEHVVRLETRPANIEGVGEVVQRDLVRNALRMRPDRIIVGEVRGSEVLDMLQAMNTGHDGSMTTLHANSPRDALRRLETMILMSGFNFTSKVMREQIASAINVIIHIGRLSDGTRKVLQLSEITGMEGDVISMQDIFIFKKSGVSEDGRIMGTFQSTGIRPKFNETLRASGISFPSDIFEEGDLSKKEFQV